MSRERRVQLGITLAGAFTALIALSSPGCLSRRDDDATPARSRCTSCHGSESRPGTDTDKAAPPFDLSGSESPSSRGVGAHQIHLAASETHAALACEQCHSVPTEVTSPGHADSARPAEVALSLLAAKGGRSPAYDSEKLTCTDTYCHRAAGPIWTSPRSSQEACGGCHTLPPPAPHPQQEQCSKCHGEVIDASRAFVAPELHVNGTVDVSVSCHSCHGGDSSNAPPLDLAGNADRGSIGVGAHQPHLAGGQASRPVECETCHVVPASFDAEGHVDSTPHAEVVFSGVATSNASSPSWDRDAVTCTGSWCHGPAAPAASLSPAWTTGVGPLGCTGCHGEPPAAPHPQLDRCSLCHGAVIATDNATIQNRSLHVNGSIDLELPDGCSACHGSPTSPAPPSDVAGNTSTSERGVGAHQKHVNGSPFSRPVPCNECHVVPASILSPGHTDSERPAELTFSGVALSFSAQPSFDGVRCNGTYCHGAMFFDGNPSGGSNTAPAWTAVGTEEVVCGSCHAIPPPSPHPAAGQFSCSDCHANMKNGLSFVDRNLHVNGQLN